MFAGAVALQLPFIYACNTEVIDEVIISVSDNKYSINNVDLRIIMDVLIPKSEIGPSATSIKADVYFYWLIADSRVDLSRRRNLAASISRINMFAKEKYDSPLQNLSENDLGETIEAISLTNWGETDLSLLMTVCFEAMFANTVYDVNTDQKGWQWLGYMGGVPFPSVKNKYPEIMEINHLK
ncbi:MAG: hypothetical protein B6I18_05485 [Bacteroidetes bacterium 4572_112]|nr:MAG: hypothetical protein B6I18_05485 [Bacteroidetes bacterium 4572_112]